MRQMTWPHLLIIPPQFKCYSSSESNTDKFLLVGSGSSENWILIFGRSRGLDMLYKSSTWYADSTFKVISPLFAQVYVLSVKCFGGIHPVPSAFYLTKKFKPINNWYKYF